VRTLLFSTLYPSSVRPLHGIFVETRLRELLKTGQVQTQVVAPVPWFPSTHPRFGDYALIARTPPREVRHGITVDHPRYPLIPKLGLSTAPLFLAAASIAPLRRVLAEGFDFDLIDAHFYYPDGVAATLLGRFFGKPVAITARGTDLNLYPAHAVPRRLMQWAAHRADASIGVCSALVDVLRGWDVEASRLHVMRNGVDLQRFHPVPAAEARRRLGQDGAPLLLSVGHLIERKGHHLVIEALAHLRRSLPQARLLVAGDGEERQSLCSLVRRLGLDEAVHFAGAVPNERLADFYAAADIALLASSREGWANVLLESMACGTPVVATDIWGTPEVVAAPEAGVLVGERTGPALAEGVQRLLSAYPAREDVRRYAEGFSWRQTSQAQLDLFRRLSGGRVALSPAI
jgi:glycosyltransferase involved in cell wall biosynthesis